MSRLFPSLQDRVLGGGAVLIGVMIGVLALAIAGALIVKVATRSPLIGVAGAMLVAAAIGYVAARR